MVEEFCLDLKYISILSIKIGCFILCQDPPKPAASPSPVPESKDTNATFLAKTDGRITASPLAKKMAAEKGVDLSVSRMLARCLEY